MRMAFLAILSLATPALGDTVWATSRVTDVTIYPYTAEITRQTPFDLPAGAHRLMLPDLPQGLDAGSLRFVAPEGVGIGAVRVRHDRQPPVPPAPEPQVEAAEAAVRTLEDAKHAAEAALSERDGQIAAAAARIAFLERLGSGPDGTLATGAADTLRDIARMIGEGILSAQADAREAEAARPAIERRIAEIDEDLDRARQALAALSPEAPGAPLFLSVDVELAAPQSGVLSVTYGSGGAYWEPLYRLNLDRAEVPELTIERLIGVTQNTGEDWQDVQLTVSTGRSSEQSAASVLSPRLWRIMPESTRAASQFGDGVGMAGERAAAPVPEPMMAPTSILGEVVPRGLNFAYRFPRPVDLLTGAEAALFPLPSVSPAITLSAWATAYRDDTAFINAAMTNTTGELLLPGDAALFLDGAAVGSVFLDMVPPGAKADIGFGPIEGLRLTRYVEDRTAGDRGMIRRSNDLVETAVVEVENLTDLAWPVRLIDSVPYSEQEDLKIGWSADPRPTETDPEGQRGILVWEFDIGPGETRTFRIDQDITWPDGMILR